MTKNSYSVWSLSDDFQINNTNPNPSSVWSYGNKKEILGPFTLYTQLLADPKNSGVYAWYETGVNWDTPGNWLGVYYNSKTTSVNLTYPSQIITFPPHGVAMQSGNDSRFSVARYTTPIDGIYNITATFTRIDIDSNTTNASTGVYIIYKNYQLFVNNIYGMRGATLFNTSINLKANEVIDFIVGVGPDKIDKYDMTN
ncbi:3360_t:CDS:2 [Dentiscutata erythropus]|uniref:3360_t:CDS:1 n=1 Tax=Dentiscutata erythropus TaxID=1348616 RepID=A0A9N9IU76_9GLOM|nr:3360_t:CDS:2 [Dentiscutata erythropus]